MQASKSSCMVAETLCLSPSGTPSLCPLLLQFVRSQIHTHIHTPCTPLHRPIYQAFQALRDGPEWEKLTAAQKRIVDNELRDFKWVAEVN